MSFRCICSYRLLRTPSNTSEQFSHHVTVVGAVAYLEPWLSPLHVDTDGITSRCAGSVTLLSLTVSQRTVSHYRTVSVAALL
jgi:hypothetical protein